jgi:hypothetical protein
MCRTAFFTGQQRWGMVFINVCVILGACDITEFENPWLSYVILHFLLNAIK